MEIIQDKRFTGKVLQIDDKHFIGCTLVDCILQYAGGHVIMDGTTMTGCGHIFVGPAHMTINYLEAVGLIPHTGLAPGQIDDTVH